MLASILKKAHFHLVFKSPGVRDKSKSKHIINIVILPQHNFSLDMINSKFMLEPFKFT